jgi:carbonic anhydrase/acetyltransferase-like protein (isoleucine patch superfamily)
VLSGHELLSRVILKSAPSIGDLSRSNQGDALYSAFDQQLDAYARVLGEVFVDQDFTITKGSVLRAEEHKTSIRYCTI